jgi:uncharacterized SAM-binding protein YcdF (DUF218 family)
LLGIAAILLLALLALCLWIAWQGRQEEIAPADAIVVLGAAQWNGRPSPVLQARLDRAIALYLDGWAPLLVLTGGSSPADAPSEAAVGREYALAQGIPPAAILLEDQSHTTVENLRGTWEMLAPLGSTEILLVSDPFHMARARCIARNLGFTAHPVPTRTSPISERPLEEAWYVLREALALIVYWVTGT